MKKINTYSVKNWSDVPTVWRNIDKIKEVDFKYSPYDKELLSILSPFKSDDSLRPVLMGVNFDDIGVTVTNAHILVNLPNDKLKHKGTYATFPKANYKDIRKDDEVKINNDLFSKKYPNYQAVVPTRSDEQDVFEFSVYKLLQYNKASLNYSNPVTNSIVYSFGKKKMGFNGKFLNDILTLSLQLGYEKLYSFTTKESRAMILSPSENYQLGKDIIFLIMPIMLNS